MWQLTMVVEISSQLSGSLFVILVDVLVKSSSKTIWNCREKYPVLIFRIRATIPIFKAPLLAWYFFVFTLKIASFAVILSLEFLFECQNPGLTGITIGTSLGNLLVSLLDSIFHIH